MAEKKAFLRDATGLVREFSAWDALKISLSLNGIWFILTYTVSTAALTGGDPLTGLLLPLTGWFFIGLAFAIVTTVAPRTAGDYVFTTRYLSPALGFVGNAGIFLLIGPIGGIGISVPTIVTLGVSPLLAYWGLLYSNLGLVTLATMLETNPVYEFLVGGSIVFIFGVIPILGNRIFKAFNRIVFPLVMLSVAVTLIVLVATPQAAALSRLNSLAGDPNFVQSVNAWGAANNNPPPSFSSFGNALAMNAVYGAGFSGIILSTYYAGEIRHVKKSVPFSITGTLLIMAFSFVFATVLSYVTFGYDFLSNLYTESIVFASLPLPVIPYLDFLVAAISPSVIIGSLIIFVVLVSMGWYISNSVFVCSRLLFSYSFDRILPALFSDISDKYRVPAKAMIASLFIGLLGGLLFMLPSAGIAFILVGACVATEFIFPITVLGFAMLAFRLRNPDQFKASPIARTYMGGPLYYISAIATIVFSLFTFYQYITIPALFGFAGTTGLELIIGPIIIMFVLYFISKYINMRRGIRFDIIFKQIPPE